MWFIYLGVVMLGLWLLEVGSFGELPWYVALLPFALAFLWFEFGERATGWDKRKRRKESEAEEARKQRIRAQFAKPTGRSR